MPAIFYISLTFLIITAIGLASTPKDVSWPVVTLAVGAAGLLFSILIMILGTLWATIIIVVGICIGLINLAKRQQDIGTER